MAQEMAQLSLIGELPKILDEGRKEAACILERFGDPVKIGLQTNELVLPAKGRGRLLQGPGAGGDGRGERI